MPKYTPKLPLTLDNTQPGYEHLTDIEGVVKQNMRMMMMDLCLPILLIRKLKKSKLKEMIKFLKSVKVSLSIRSKTLHS